MDDSDDDYYFSNDLILDDKTVAVLDEQESKFRLAVSTQHQQVTVGPPAKRQKTTGSWRPQPAQPVTNNRVLRRTDTMEDMEDLPDVSIRQDGTYGLQDRQRPLTFGPPTTATRSGTSHGVGAGSNVLAHPTVSQRPSTTTAPSSRFPPPVRVTPSVPAPIRTTNPYRPRSSVQGPRVVQSPVSSQEVTRTEPQRVNRVPSTTQATPGGDYVEQLRQQLEELREKHVVVQAGMEAALEAKLAKEGESTILRKRMEKATQDHLAQIAKLKAAKDESDAQRVSLQKQYDADKERWKTELTFKRYEMEASSRKHVPPRNDSAQVADPGPLSSQRQKSGPWNLAGPSRPVPETPRRPRFGVISEFEKSKKPTLVETRDLPSGFQTGPSRSQMERKGKETTSFGAAQPSLVIPSASPVRVPQGPGSQFRPPDIFAQMDDEGLTEDFLPLPQADVGADNIRVIDEGTPISTLSSQENSTVLDLPNWNLILHDIVTTHTLQGSKLPTLQVLVCASPADMSQVQSYSTALMRIFDTLGGIPTQPDRDFNLVAKTICCALCEITELLARNSLVSPLTAVLNLLTNLAYMLPSIHVLLLPPCVQEHHETPQLLGVLHSIIQGQPKKQNPNTATENESPDLCSLGKETLSLYEALVWWIFDDLENTLIACPGMPSLLTTLLHPHRPLWFLVRSTRILLWLSTRRNLFRLLLSCPANEQTASGESVVPPQISLACALLTDTDRQGPEGDELKSHIIMFFGMLSIAHPDAYTSLVESQELIPSIVLYLHHLVAPIWDENGIVLDDPQALARKVHIVCHTTLLLHHLVIGEDATLDLRERLLHAQAKTQGLFHFFILTLGRLSYANPPYWLAEKDRERLGNVADLARALLERVIQGPELDSIWETYQDDGEESNEAAMDVDDEEVEAQKIADS